MLILVFNFALSFCTLIFAFCINKSNNDEAVCY